MHACCRVLVTAWCESCSDARTGQNGVKQLEARKWGPGIIANLNKEARPGRWISLRIIKNKGTNVREKQGMFVRIWSVIS
jgi:hypothetical protein